MENNRANLVARVKDIIMSKGKDGEMKNRIYFPARNDGYDFDKIKKQYNEPTNAEDAATRKMDMIALELDDIAQRVDVDTTDDKKRKNKGHDRAAELSNFLSDVAEEIRKNPKGVGKEKIQLAGYLLKLSKTQKEEAEAMSADERIDEMLSEAFSKFDLE